MGRSVVTWCVQSPLLDTLLSSSVYPSYIKYFVSVSVRGCFKRIVGDIIKILYRMLAGLRNKICWEFLLNSASQIGIVGLDSLYTINFPELAKIQKRLGIITCESQSIKSSYLV